jgi:uncharacterized membrane protein
MPRKQSSYLADIMRKVGMYVLKAVGAGALIVVPVYLSVLLLLKAANSSMILVRPLVSLLPAWIPAERLLSLSLVLAVLFLIGVAARTRAGLAAWAAVERMLFRRIPGYELFRGLTERVADESHDTSWKPALVEIEDALVPAFIIEALEDDQYTVFVPSSPTPFAGAIYVIQAARVHPVDVPFGRAVKAISRWGSGTKELVTAMKAGTKAER